MASFDSLPLDQKAVLSMVLQHGRSFDQISAMLSIDRARVRQRALEGFDLLGPDTGVDPLQRSLITDYLVGQLPPRVAAGVRESLATNANERAWARVIAAEIAPLAVNGLPEIPDAGAALASDPGEVAEDHAGAVGHGGDAVDDGAGALADEEERFDDEEEELFDDEEEELFDDEEEPFDDEPLTTPDPASAGATLAPAVRDDTPQARTRSAGALAEPELPRSSRRGGAILLGLIAVVIIAVVVILLVTHKSSHPATSPGATTARSGSGTGTTAAGTGTGITPEHEIDLASPSGSTTVQGAADVVKAAGKLGLIIAAQGLAPSVSGQSVYAVWLENSSTGAKKNLGFYERGVAATGKTKGDLEAEVALPADASKYNQLLLTLETKASGAPGTTVLEGAFTD